MAEQASLPEKGRVPQPSEFPAGTEFVIKEWAVPLAHIPPRWINWFGGIPRPYDPQWLKVDNHWPAESFEEWAAVIAASING